MFVLESNQLLFFSYIELKSCSSDFLRCRSFFCPAIPHNRDVDSEEPISQTTGTHLRALHFGHTSIFLFHHARSNQNRSHRTLFGLLLRMYCLCGLYLEGLSSSGWKSIILFGLLYAL